MIFFHLKNCLFSPFPCRARRRPTSPGMPFIFPPRVAILRGTVAPLRLFLKALPAFCTDFVRNFCAFIQPLPPQCTEFPPAFCIKQRIKHTSFLFVQCPEALHVSSAQAVKRLPLGTRGAGPTGLRGFERCKFRRTLNFATNPLRHFLRKCHLPLPCGARQEEAFHLHLS